MYTFIYTRKKIQLFCTKQLFMVNSCMILCLTIINNSPTVQRSFGPVLKKTNHYTKSVQNYTCNYFIKIGWVVLGCEKKHISSPFCAKSQCNETICGRCVLLPLLPKGALVFFKPCPLFTWTCQSARLSNIFVFFAAAVKWVHFWAGTGLWIPHITNNFRTRKTKVPPRGNSSRTSTL